MNRMLHTEGLIVGLGEGWVQRRNSVDDQRYSHNDIARAILNAYLVGYENGSNDHEKDMSEQTLRVLMDDLCDCEWCRGNDG
ncbi:MAG: hypothetical protein CL946_06330 [Ectothiorhodospiraceae bacterium]|nr:hypothetical protein [Ectothiorhodospiraceae bacterium]